MQLRQCLEKNSYCEHNIGKDKRPQIYSSHFHLYKLEKKSRLNPRASKRKEIIMIRV